MPPGLNSSPYLHGNLAAHDARWHIPLTQIAPEGVQVDAVPSGGGRHPLSSSSWPDAGLVLRARIQGPDGIWVKVHSDRHPYAESEDWCRASLPDGAGAAVVVVGAGLGYVVEVLAQDPHTHILVLEPEPALVPWLLARRDWRAEIDAGRLLIVPGPEYEAASRAWPLLQHAHRSAPPTLLHPVIARARPAAAAAAGLAMGRALHGARANALARKRFEAPYLLNTLANVPRLLASPGVCHLAGRARGRPVVIAGAGPSLNRNIEDLRPHRADVLLIAADTALKPLLSAGLAPDYVVAVDPGELNARHLRDAPAGPGTTLVAEASVHPASFTPFEGRTVMFRVAAHSPWPWLTSLGIDPGQLRAWGSVITSAFDLALVMQADPIVFIGADLAYTNGQPYCRGTTYESDWAAAAQAGGLGLAQVWDQLVTPQAVTADDLAGEPVRTAPHLVAFRDWLVGASSVPTRVVNATGAGILHGPGVESATLPDALAGTRARHSSMLLPRMSGPLQHLPPTNPLDAHLLNLLITPTSGVPPPAHEATPSLTSPHMRTPLEERVNATRRLRAERLTDMSRWLADDQSDAPTERRVLTAATLIPGRARVLDLGAGNERLSCHLPPGATCVPVDVVPRSSRTLLADVNAGDFPAGDYDVVTMLGLIEYVHDPQNLLTKTAARVPMLVMSYCAATRDDCTSRMARGWLNDLTLSDLLDLLMRAGWHVAWACRLDARRDFDQWLLACRRSAGPPG
jgi:hypothetical protein